MLEAYDNILQSNISKYITSMAHPFSVVRSPHSQGMLIDMTSDDTLKRMFDKTAKKDIAVEINTGCVLFDFDSQPTKENVNESKLIRVYQIALILIDMSHILEKMKRSS